jgi:fibronectin type III domain protein
VIRSYTVTVSPGGQKVSRYADLVFVSGLTNGVTYTFTVTATNAIGTGPPPPLPPPAGTRSPSPGH